MVPATAVPAALKTPLAAIDPTAGWLFVQVNVGWLAMGLACRIFCGCRKADRSAGRGRSRVGRHNDFSKKLPLIILTVADPEALPTEAVTSLV